MRMVAEDIAIDEPATQTSEYVWARICMGQNMYGWCIRLYPQKHTNAGYQQISIYNDVALKTAVALHM